jgi:acetylornithine deacetylase
MMHVLRALEIDENRLEMIRHPLVGKATWNVGRIEGGTQVNVVPADCVVEIDRRLIPGEDPTRVKSQYEQLLSGLRTQTPSWEARLEEPFLSDWPLDTASDSDIVMLLSEILRKRKLASEPSGAAFGSDASKFAQAGIASVILGPGSIDQAHTAEEYVDVDQVETSFLVYRDLMLRYE